MADRTDAAALREIWNPESLSMYEGKWIAFRHTFEPSSLPNDPNLQALLDRFDVDIKANNSPIFAFVTFRVIV